MSLYASKTDVCSVFTWRYVPFPGSPFRIFSIWRRILGNYEALNFILKWIDRFRINTAQNCSLQNGTQQISEISLVLYSSSTARQWRNYPESRACSLTYLCIKRTLCTMLNRRIKREWLQASTPTRNSKSNNSAIANMRSCQPVHILVMRNGLIRRLQCAQLQVCAFIRNTQLPAINQPPPIYLTVLAVAGFTDTDRIWT